VADERPLRHEDPALLRQMRRLYYLRLWIRWGAIALAWLLLVPLSLWSLRDVVQRWGDYFGWATLRYAIAHHRLEAIALSFCIALVTATLLRHSWHMLRGLSARELADLRRDLLAIRDRGPEHPLWRWVVVGGDPRSVVSSTAKAPEADNDPDGSQGGDQR
jgi:hypothetical protein